MKRIYSFTQQSTYFAVLLMLLMMASPAMAEDITIATSIADSNLEVGDEFHVFVRLNLDNALSTGGYVDITYNDTDLNCVEVVNYNIFGQGNAQIQSCPDSGTIRITSMAASFADAKTFPSGKAFAAITFQAKQVVASTEIQFAVTSQIFGTRGGNILTDRDNSATSNVLIAAAKIPPADPTEPPAYPAGPPADPTEPPADPTEPPIDPVGPTVVPEPSTFLLILSGFAVILWMRRRKR